MSVYAALRSGWKELMRNFKEQITITHITNETIDDDTIVTTTTTTTTTYAIVYTYSNEFFKYDMGEMPSGDIIFMLGKDETINVRDTITYKSTDYKVTKIEEMDTRGGIVGYLAYCTQT